MYLTIVLGALLIRAGFALHGAGMVRSKNSAGAVMRQMCDACVAILAVWAVGYAIVLSGNRVFGIEWRDLFGPGRDDSGFPSLAAMVLIATGIVPGAVAERARFWPSLAGSALLAGLVVPVAILWCNGGWLERMGLTDFGGAAYLHLPGALCAAAGAVMIGARTGKFNRDGSSTAIPGHSVPLAGIGAFVLLIGLVVFIGQLGGGRTLDATERMVSANAALTNVLLACAAAGLASMVLGQFRYHKPDVHLTYAGVVGGAVSISAGAGNVPGIGAVLIGAVAGVIVPMAILMVDLYGRIDDPSGNISIHGVGAIWGLVATPLLARNLPVADRFKGLGVSLLAILAIGALTVGLSVGLWLLLKKLTKVRVSEADEFDGLDLAEHDIGAYPDFQQNTIKSYHLREV